MGARRIERTGDRDVHVKEVGLRDGLQILKTIMPTDRKIAWIRDSVAAGIDCIEVTSFVPPDRLPQLADAARVVEAALSVEGLFVDALVPNLRGAMDAVASGVHRINCVVSVSEAHNQSNLRRSTERAIEEVARIVAYVREQPPERQPLIAGGLATCFGCTLGGHVPEDDVRRVAAKVMEAGVDELLVADTVGYGNPAAVRRVFTALRRDIGPDVPMAAHFHDTRGTGLANVVAAIDCGITHFDASLGGLGGCPYAPNVTGNVVTEDLVYMLEAMGLRTGIDLAALLDIRRRVEAQLPGERFEGSLARAGIPGNYKAVGKAA